MTQLARATRISEAAECLIRLESPTRSQVENLVFSTEGRSELLITSSPMSQPALRISTDIRFLKNDVTHLITVTEHRAISQKQSLSQSADSILIHVTALTLVPHLFGNKYSEF